MPMYNFDANAINDIVDALADRPYRRVFGLINDIQAQVRNNAQTEQIAAHEREKATAADAEELAKLRAKAAEEGAAPKAEAVALEGEAETPPEQDSDLAAREPIPEHDRALDPNE